jgi:hypothetical protein
VIGVWFNPINPYLASAKLENISNLTRHLLSLPEFSEEECGKMLDEIEKSRAK